MIAFCNCNYFTGFRDRRWICTFLHLKPLCRTMSSTPLFHLKGLRLTVLSSRKWRKQKHRGRKHAKCPIDQLELSEPVCGGWVTKDVLLYAPFVLQEIVSQAASVRSRNLWVSSLWWNIIAAPLPINLSLKKTTYQFTLSETADWSVAFRKLWSAYRLSL